MKIERIKVFRHHHSGEFYYGSQKHRDDILIGVVTSAETAFRMVHNLNAEAYKEHFPLFRTNIETVVYQ